jgi:hypothetical protein
VLTSYQAFFGLPKGQFVGKENENSKHTLIWSDFNF